MLNEALRDRISRFFSQGSNNRPLLQIINFIEDAVYAHIPENMTNAKKVFIDVYLHCYAHYKSKFACEEKKCFKKFYKHIKNFRSRLPVAGVIIVNKQGEFLCVVEENNVLNFPIGKLDYNDEDDLKRTAFRELFEETGVRVTYDEFEKAQYFVDIPLKRCGYTKLFRFYIVEGFEGPVKINHRRRGEIKGLAWVRPVDVKQLSSINIRVLNPTSRLQESTFPVSDFLKEFVDRSERILVNPFQTIGCRYTNRQNSFKRTINYWSNTFHDFLTSSF